MRQGYFLSEPTLYGGMTVKVLCMCVDSGCTCGGNCQKHAETTLYRIDMEDYTGTDFCEECAADAMESGVFSDEEQSCDTDDEPCEEDYTLTPCGSLGAKTGVGIIGGKFLGEFTDDETAMQFIRERMAEHRFYPNVWYVSDHGNWSLITA